MLLQYITSAELAPSTLRYNPIRSVGLSTTIHAEGHNSILQHIPGTCRKGWLALHPQRSDKIRKEAHGMLCSQRQRNDCELPLPAHLARWSTRPF